MYIFPRRSEVALSSVDYTLSYIERSEVMAVEHSFSLSSTTCVFRFAPVPLHRRKVTLGSRWGDVELDFMARDRLTVAIPLNITYTCVLEGRE